jgi:protein-disulfide isomerase
MSLRHPLIALCLLLAACTKPDADADPQPAASSPPPFDLAKIDRARQMGSDSAKVWLIMGSDFECPYCKSFHHDTWPRIEREYVRTGKVRVAFMNHPMSLRPPFSMHPRAIPAAEAAMCAGAQDRFWAMHDSLFVNQEKWARGDNPQALFESYATGLGLEMASWRNCMSSHATRDMVHQDYARTKQVGIEGTPSFVIGNELAVVGAAPYGDFKKALDDALAKVGR